MAFRTNSNWKTLKTKVNLTVSEMNEVFDTIPTIAGDDPDVTHNATEQTPTPQTRDEMLTQAIESLADNVARIDIGAARQNPTPRSNQPSG